MLVKEYRRYQQQAQSLYTDATDHHTELLILAERLKISPNRIEKMRLRDPIIYQARLELMDEIAPAFVQVNGTGPWEVRLCEDCCPHRMDDASGRGCSFICVEHPCECGAEVFCEVREALFRDLEKMTPANRAGILTGLVPEDMDWAVYRTVEEVVSRSLTSPFSPWDGRSPHSQRETATDPC